MASLKLIIRSDQDEQEDKMKYVTLTEFLNMPPSEQCKVQHLDLSLASEEDRAKMRSSKEGKNHG